MRPTLVIGLPIRTFDLLLDADLSNPMNTPYGIVSLQDSTQTLLQYYIGHSSPKYNIENYYRAIEICYHRFMEGFPGRRLTIRCHDWRSGVGSVILADIIRIVQPQEIIASSNSRTQAQALTKVQQSFLQGVYTIPNDIQFQITDAQVIRPQDVKADRARQLSQYFSSGNDMPFNSLNSLSPVQCFIADLKFFINNTPAEKTLIQGLLGKVVGLCQYNDQMAELKGLGIVKDIDLVNDTIMIVQKCQSIQDVDCIQCYTGDDSLQVGQDLAWAEDFYEKFELDPVGIARVVMWEFRNRYHPGRKYKT